MHAPREAGEYDAIVIGSDEVWNFRHPWFGSRPIFFGDDLKAARIVSYAASFGNHEAAHGIDPDWARKLDRFSAISVRDENSLQLVRSGTDREPSLVLDPCLLVPEVARSESEHPASNYVAVYGHGFPKWLQRRVRRWADSRGLTLLSVGYLNEWAGEQRIGTGPAGFARLMSGAAAIVTNFFHGCVFALLNGKPWASTPSAYRSIKIPDLVALLGIEQRLIHEQTPLRQVAELLETPVQPAVATRIQEFRRRSNAYLDAALS